MSITRERVEQVARLARLQLSPAELEQMTLQLGQILGYIEQLASLDTAQLEPLVHAVEMRNVFREDELRPGLAREAALANAPQHDDECFLVPPVLGE